MGSPTLHYQSCFFILKVFHFFSDKIPKEKKKATLHKESKAVRSSVQPPHVKSIVKEEKRLVGKNPIDWKTTIEMNPSEPKVMEAKDKEENDEIDSNQVAKKVTNFLQGSSINDVTEF